MKSYIYISLSLLLLSTFVICPSSFAQRVAVQGSVNRSKVNIDQLITPKEISGFDIGFYIEIPLTPSELLNLNTGIDFALKGGSNEGTSKRMNLSYIEIPLTLSFRLNLVKGKLAILPSVGIYGGYLVRAMIKDTGHTIFQDDYNYNNYDSFEKLDYGAKAGVAIELAGNIQTGVEYNFGFTDVQKEFYKNIEQTRIFVRLFF